MDAASFKLSLTLLTPVPLPTFFYFCDMHSGRKHSLSPPAIQGTRPRKAPRPNGRAGGRVEQRVAPVEQVTAPYNTPGGGDSPAFIFGNTQGISLFSSTQNG